MKTLTESLKHSFVTEAKYKGIDIQNTGFLDVSNFGTPVKSIRDLKKGSIYILHEPGMNVWSGPMEFVGMKGKAFKFKSDIQFDDFDVEYTKEEIADEINQTLVYNHKA